MIMELEHVDFKYLPMLAHLAEYDSTSLVEVGIYKN